MPSTTHSEFGANTEAAEVAKAFASSIKGKTILVTGGNRNGLGFSAAQGFASQAPAHLILVGRNPERIGECIDALKAEHPNVDYRPLTMDLSSQQSVREAAAELMEWSDVPTLDIIVNSAGVMGLQERTLNDDGVEMHFATNHIGHWLFSCLVMPKMIKAADGKPKGSVRIVNVSSGSPMFSTMRWSDMNFDRKNRELPESEQPDYPHFSHWGYKNTEDASYIPLDGYNRSKVANVLFSVGVNKRLFDKFGILSAAVHPGVIGTDLGRNFPEETMNSIKEMEKRGVFKRKSLEAGSSTGLVAALDPKLAVGVGETKDGKENYGAFFEDCQISSNANATATSSSDAERLWRYSEKIAGEEFVW